MRIKKKKRREKEGTLERGYFGGEKNRRLGHLLSYERGGKLQHYGYFEEESYNFSFFGGHHLHTWIISGGDSEVSRLNFFTCSLSSSSSYAFSPSSSSFISFDMKIVLLGCG